MAQMDLMLGKGKVIHRLGGVQVMSGASLRYSVVKDKRRSQLKLIKKLGHGRHAAMPLELNRGSERAQFGIKALRALPKWSVSYLGITGNTAHEGFLPYDIQPFPSRRVSRFHLE